MQPPQLREVLGQRAPQRDLQVPAPVLTQLDLVDADLEHVAGLGAFDCDRSGEKMRPGPDIARIKNLAMPGNDGEAARGVGKVLGLA